MYTRSVHLVAVGSAGSAVAADDFGTLEDSEIMAVSIKFSGTAAPGTTEVKVVSRDPEGNLIEMVDYVGNSSQGWLRVVGPVYDSTLAAIVGVYASPFVNGVVSAEISAADAGTVVDVGLILRELG